MPKTKGPLPMISRLRPEFAHLSDEQVSDLYRKTDLEWKGGGSDEQLDALESKLFALDDELCARDMDLPE